jgi:SAM-dependent methyltransferase
MNNKLSPRLEEIINALPLCKGIRVLEIGCGPGAAAREIAKRVENSYVLGIDRSKKAIQLAVKNANKEIASGKLNFRQVAVENFELKEYEQAFDIAFAIRVGALDGRHPKIEDKALSNIARSLTKKGKLFIDGGKPLKEISLDKYR